MSRTVIACDPGTNGAIVWRHPGDKAQATSMPATRGDTISLIKGLIEEGTDPLAYIEKVASFIPDGGASQMFEFGRQIERVGCILETLDVRLLEVRPVEWQAHFNVGKVGTLKVSKDMDAAQKKRVKAANAKLKTEWKNKLKAEAQRRFPHLKVTLKNADALLILDAALRMEGMQP
ncbi:MAG TPA: hypothetical protein VIT91_15905 [Chthoniobacterales bacterium]